MTSTFTPAEGTSTDPQRPTRAWWWGAACIWWILNGLTHASSRASMNGQPFGQALRYDMISALLWVPFTVLAFWMAVRVPATRHTWRRALLLYCAGAASVVLVRALFVVITDPFLHWYPTTPSVREVLITSIANNLFMFFLLVGAGHAVAYARRIRERDELLARAELLHLKAQLHPHFLFNTLNTISVYVRAEPDTAVQMLAHLGTLLRHALQRAGVQEVALEEELAIVAAYIDIEQVRFDDRLRVVWQVPGDLLPATVPHLLLQPLVENAIRHGLASLARTGTVEIRAERQGDHLHLLVRDDGVGLPERGVRRDGIGLSNVRQRLRQLYGNAQAFTVTSRVPQGLEVRVMLPLRLSHRG